jgi:hypothetical protein
VRVCTSNRLVAPRPPSIEFSAGALTRGPQGTLMELDGLDAADAQVAINLPIVSNQRDPIRLRGVG